MNAKVIRPQLYDIQKRFIEAINLLIDSGKIKSLAAFCEKYELHRPRYSNIKNHFKDPSKGTGYKLIDTDALAFLVKDYGISADWLLLGQGGMFKK